MSDFLDAATVESFLKMISTENNHDPGYSVTTTTTLATNMSDFLEAATGSAALFEKCYEVM